MEKEIRLCNRDDDIMYNVLTSSSDTSSWDDGKDKGLWVDNALADRHVADNDRHNEPPELRHNNQVAQ